MRYRDWLWRGWQVRYAFLPAASPDLQRPPILLLHGFGAAIGQWRANFPTLAEHHIVYAIDLVGFGGSEKSSMVYNNALWVEQVYDFWRLFVNHPAVIVGNSLGALVGLMAAHRHPEMSRGIVAISLPDLSELEAAVPAPVRPLKRSLEATIGSLLAMPLFYFLRRPSTIRWVLRNAVYMRERDRVDDELVEIIAGPARDRKAAQAFFWLNRSMISAEPIPSAQTAIAQLQVPLLIVWGLRDRFIPPALGHKLVACSPLAELVELPELGHCPHDEDPARVNQEILNWMRDKID